MNIPIPVKLAKLDPFESFVVKVGDLNQLSICLT